MSERSRPIDGILKIMLEQGASELQLASGHSPRLLDGDTELPLTMPSMSPATLRTLLGDLWAARAELLHKQGRVQFAYRHEALGNFNVVLHQAGEGEATAIEASFLRVAGAGPAAALPDAVSEATAKPVAPAVRVTASPAAARTGASLPPRILALLARAVSAGASDVHLSDGSAAVARIDGRLTVLDEEPVHDVGALLDPAQLDRVRAGESVDLSIDLDSIARLRANVYVAGSGIAAALRLLPRRAPRLAELELPKQLRSLVDLPHGLVIVCGPTGSGKSTTLAALAQESVDRRARLLISLEDPVEYLIQPEQSASLVRQREIGGHVRDFATGLRDALREDPDVLLIGEMRDPESISLALTAAETGHLVLTSLHSRTAASAVERIVDVYPAGRQKQIRVQLADALRAVVAQRLLPRSAGNGRVPAVECLRATHGVANLIREGKTAQLISSLQSGGDEGMVILERSLADLVRAGTVTREAAGAAANDAKTFEEYLRY